MKHLQKFRSNATVVISNKAVRVKTERTIEQALGIKTERNSTNRSVGQSKSHRSNVLDSGQDNNKFINRIAELQKDNQRNVLDLKKKDSEIATLQQEKYQIEEKFTEKVDSLSVEVQALQSKLSDIKTQHAKQRDVDQKTIFDLNKNIRLLEARNKQLQTGLCQEKQTQLNQNISNKPENRIFEVKELVGHKQKKDGMYFLVRWKNFNPSDDTWEHESNLMCPKILKAYKQKWQI